MHISLSKTNLNYPIDEWNRVGSVGTMVLTRIIQDNLVTVTSTYLTLSGFKSIRLMNLLVLVIKRFFSSQAPMSSLQFSWREDTYACKAGTY